MTRSRRSSRCSSPLRSSPSAYAGRSLSAGLQLVTRSRCCDPRPARTPGAAGVTGVVQTPDPAVAILAQRVRRAQPDPTGHSRSRAGRCDPRPARTPGAAPHVRCSAAAVLELRSSPSAYAGRSTGPAGPRRSPPAVAILAQRVRRAQPRQARRPDRSADRCDPRPARTPGAATPRSPGIAGCRSLRSSPSAYAWRSEGALTGNPDGGQVDRCDPRPARTPGAAVSR